jgi:hypothetical protein
MEALWLAILLYSLGLAAALHFRPALMFHENGTWKEFGYQRDSRHTILPFWLFSIIWAILSYTLATAISWSTVTATASAATSAAYYNGNLGSWSSGPSSYEEEEYDQDQGSEEEEVIPVSNMPAKRGRGRPRKTETAQPRTGYYVLEPQGNESDGLRRYVYYGSTPPPA